MFRFTRRRLGKLLMCHRLELFIEKDEPGQRGAAFDLWRFILRIKKPTPPTDPRSELPGACTFVCALEQAVHLPMEHNNSQQTLRLLRSFNGALDE